MNFTSITSVDLGQCKPLDLGQCKPLATDVVQPATAADPDCPNCKGTGVDDLGLPAHVAGDRRREHEGT